MLVNMKRTIKILGWGGLALILGLFACGFYSYNYDPFVNALIHNDESKIFFRPSREIQNMEDLCYSKKILTVEDSIKIHTFLFAPIAKAKANIFLIRGNAGNTSKAKDLIKPLVNYGFRVYTLDWRGYGESNGVPNYRGVMKDTQTAFKDFLLRIENDTIKTIVYGMSLGGQLAINLTKHNSSKIDALVLEGTLESAHSFIADNVQEFYLKTFIRQPKKYNQDYMAVRDIADIENVPKLIIHSKMDRAVPFERGRNIFRAAQEPKMFWETHTEHIKTIPDMPEELTEKLQLLIEKPLLPK